MSRAPEMMRRWAPAPLMMASGFAGLGYQIVWTQQCTSWLGHEAAAMLAVVAAFFGGLAIGGLTLGPRIERSPRPERWYAACELVVALWGVFLLFALEPFGSSVLKVIGEQPTAGLHWLVAFCSTFLVFFPATAAMGATLPAMERLTAPKRPEQRSIAALYASNTLGAVLGVLVTAFWLIPGVGLKRSAAVCILLNLGCSAGALWLFPTTPARAVDSRNTPTPNRVRARWVVTQLAVTGLLGIGYEVLVVRVLSQVTEDTIYTFALILAVYLLGTAAGAASYQRWGQGRAEASARTASARTEWLLAAVASAGLFGTLCLFAADPIRAWALRAFEGLGSGMAPALAAEATLALVTFGLPTLAMGALFSHLSRSASAAGVSFGRSIGVNTLAAAAAPALFGVVAIPLLGSKMTLLLVPLGYLALTGRRAWSTRTVWVPAAGVIAVGVLGPPLRFVEIPEGGQLVSYQEGVMAAVSVVEDESGVLRLRIDDRQQEGSSASFRVDARQAWLPLLLHPAPRRALFLGLGTGVTASSAADDPTLTVDAVELLPEVIAASNHFRRDQASGAAEPRLHVIAADARRYVRVSAQRYDVIVSDNFHPARSGSGALYTVEHFEAVSRRLDEGGVFCQWLPIHQLDLETLRSIVRSFVAAYPQSFGIIASNSLETPVLGLVARAAPAGFDMSALRSRLAQMALPDRRANLGLEDEYAVLGSVVAGPAALVRFAANAPANTDDHPVVAYRAPRITYVPDSSPGDRLIALLAELSIEPAELILPTADPAWPRRLAAYWAARNRFIESGRGVRPSPHVEEMLAQVQEPLLSVVRISPDFRPAYDPLLSMATALARSNVSGARTLLSELARLSPARSEAPQLLTLLVAEASSVEPAPR